MGRLDVAMFNAILRESAEEMPTDPVSDPISDSKVLPIPASKSSFGAGVQLKNAVSNGFPVLYVQHLILFPYIYGELVYVLQKYAFMELRSKTDMLDTVESTNTCKFGLLICFTATEVYSFKEAKCLHLVISCSKCYVNRK